MSCRLSTYTWSAFVYRLALFSTMVVYAYDDDYLNEPGLLESKGEFEQEFGNISDWQWQVIQNYSLVGQRCMLQYWSNPKEEEDYCSAVWDGYICWPATPPNTTVTSPCPPRNRYDLSNYTDSVALRRCNSSGRWQSDWTDYIACINLYIRLSGEQQHDDPDKDKLALILVHIYFYGGIISFLLLSLTLFIFSYFKTLQCNRVSIHKNLAVSFLVRSFLEVVIFEPLLTGRQFSYRKIDWLCKTVMSLQQYAIVANIFWMFVEGLFLHNRVAVSVFNAEASLRIFYVVGWGLPGVIVLIWATCMQLYNTHDCWNGHAQMPHIYIIIAPIILALSINAVFLVNIIRILITKLRANNTLEIDQVRKAVKATAVLFPLLGMTNLLFFFKPSGASRNMEMAYRITNAILQASQGIFVSVIYCFMNSDVRAAVLKKWQRYKTQRLGVHRGRRRSSRTSSVYLSTTENGNPHKCSTGC